jgi:hypothetical protein
MELTANLGAMAGGASAGQREVGLGDLRLSDPLG